MAKASCTPCFEQGGSTQFISVENNFDMKIKKLIKNILKLSSRHRWPLANRMIKLTEECGELAEAVNKHDGFLPHKELKEPVEGEVADVIITAIDVLRKAYQDKSEKEVMALLADQIEKKSAKWEAILERNGK